MTEVNADFYERKIRRLEEDLVMIQEELTKVRFRLRNAEDFEIKYHILLKTTQAEMYKLQDYQSQAGKNLVEETVQTKLQQNNQIWQERMKQLQAQLRQQSGKSISSLQSELASSASKLKELIYRQEEMQLFEFKLKKAERENQSLIEQLDQTKRYYEKQKENQISSLRAHLNSNFRQKLSNQRNSYENKISSLQKKIVEMDMKSDCLVNKQLEKSNAQLIEIQDRYEERIKSLELELQQQKRVTINNNQGIKKLSKQKHAISERNRSQTKNLAEIIKELEDRILQKQRDHQSELIEVVKRNKEAAESQISEFISQINNLSQDIAAKDQILLDNTLNQRKQIQNLTISFEQERNRFSEIRKELQDQITQLREQLYEKEQKKGKAEAEKLIENLVNINRKEIEVGNYQNGIIFLDRQLKKTQSAMEQKNRIIIKYSQQTLQLQSRNDKQMSQLNGRIRKQIKKNQQKVNELENQIQQLHHQLKQKQRQILNIESTAKEERDYLQSLNSQLKQQIQSLQKDYNRVFKSKSIIEASCREARQKVLSRDYEINELKSKQWLEVEKLKNECQIIYRKKEEQLISNYDRVLQSQKQQINKLIHKHDVAEKKTELLTKQNKRLISQLQNNKENCRFDTHSKKIATLNLQITLSQNILDNVLKQQNRSPTSQTPARRLAQIDISHVQYPLQK